MINIGGRKIPYEENHHIDNNVLEKKCSICQQWFTCTEEYFHKNKKSKDGLYPYCKKCNIKKSRKRILENHEEYLLIQKDYRESHSERMAFLKKQWRNNNKQHCAEYQLDWQQKYPDKCKEYNENRGHKNHKITKEEWNKCKKYFGYRCAYCGLLIEEHWVKHKGRLILSDFHKEHVNDDDSDELSNCVPSCKNCNSQKWKFDLEIWYTEDNPVFKQERLDKVYKWINDNYKTL